MAACNPVPLVSLLVAKSFICKMNHSHSNASFGENYEGRRRTVRLHVRLMAVNTSHQSFWSCVATDPLVCYLNNDGGNILGLVLRIIQACYRSMPRARAGQVWFALKVSSACGIYAARIGDIIPAKSEMDNTCSGVSCPCPRRALKVSSR